MGYWRADRTTVVISDIVGPGPQALHRQDRFEPDYAYQRAEVSRIYDVSGRLTTYLGDWHSHPAGPLSLSLTDRITLARIALTKQARAPRALMAVIAGVGESSWNVRIWVAGGRRPLLLSCWRPIVASLRFFDDREGRK